MNSTNTRHSPAWIVFTYTSFAASVGALVVGLVLMPLDLAAKGYFAMGIAMLVQSCITLTKTLRDNEESGKLANRIEDARTERLLMDVARSQP